MACFVLHSVVYYSNVSFSRLITSVLGEPLPLCAWERQRYFIVALSGPSI